MALSLVRRLHGREGLRHFIQLRLDGSRDELLGVRGVTYDLGPTFEDRYRQRPSGDAPASDDDRTSGLGIDVTAYGDFAVTARVALGNGQEAVLGLDVALTSA